MVKVYAMNIKNLPDPLENQEILCGLGKQRIEKIHRYKQLKSRKQSLGAGLLLKHCLDSLGMDMDDIAYGENGKPFLNNVCFNISHSDEMVIIAISEREIGCDIEKIGEHKQKIAKRYFTESEIAYLQEFEEHKRAEEFYRLWTIKESYVKKTGEGMKIGLDSFEIRMEQPVSIYHKKVKSLCNIKEYDIPGYKCAVCADENEFADAIEYYSS